MSLTRKQFLSSMMGAVAGAAGVAMLVGCSSNSSSGPDSAGGGANCLTNGTTITIGSNHGHALTVSAADVSAAADKTYDITGTASHPHSVTVTAALFTMLKANTAVTVTSTAGGSPSHTHSVSIGCA